MRVRAISLAALATVVLAACGPSAGQPPAPATAPAANPTEDAMARPATAPSPAASPAAGASPAAASVSINGPFPGEAKNLNGAGATFPAPLYTKWLEEYNRLTGVRVNYQAMGSGGGIKAMSERTADFAGSDAPMTDDQLKAAKGGEIFHIPTALGAIVLTYNIPEIPATTRLKFTSDTIAGIYMGEISRWNDPRLVADNPELQSVNQDIIPIHRSDGSGTTFGFTDYLSTANPTWNGKIGKGTSVSWPVGLGGNGNPGVAGEVKQNPYSVGYVELIYAVQNKLGYAVVRNKAGKFVEPTLQSVTAAASASAQNIPSDLRFSLVDARGDETYPIVTATWLLAYRNMTDQPKAVALTRLLWWATHEAQRFNNDLQYATVPQEITVKSEQFIRQISVNGQPAFPGR